MVSGIGKDGMTVPNSRETEATKTPPPQNPIRQTGKDPTDIIRISKETLTKSNATIEELKIARKTLMEIDVSQKSGQNSNQISSLPSNTTTELTNTIKLANIKLLQKIANKPPPRDNDDLNLMKEIAKQHNSLILTHKEGGSSLFSILVKKCTFDEMIEIVEALLTGNETITHEQSGELIDFMLTVHIIKGAYPIQHLNKKENFNPVFDKFIALVESEDLRTDIKCRPTLLYAFSPGRYKYLCSPNKKLEQKFNEVEFSEIKKHPKYEKWLEERKKASDSLKGNHKDRGKCVQNWNKTNALVQQLAQSKTQIDTNTICTLHKELTAGEEGVKKPGEIRREVTESVRTGGSWTKIFCPGQHVPKNMQSLDSWMKEQYELCNTNKKDPVEFAAEAYQRIVSIHPFENGNGRIARLVMDLILQQYGVLPPILEENQVLDAVFPLEPKKEGSNEKFMEKIVDGIKKSYAFFDLKESGL